MATDMTASRSAAAGDERDALREELVRQRMAGGRGRRRRIPVADRAARLPLSFGQERLWFLSMLDAQTLEYHVPLVVRLRGVLDIAGLTDAYRRVLARHEVLRTRYHLADARPTQVIDEPPAGDIPVRDVSALPEPDRGREAMAEAGRDAQVPFDLSLEHPVRARLVRLAKDEHLLAVTFHHVAFDGWSVEIFLRDLLAGYLAGGGAGKEPELPPLPVQYADYAAWQRDRLAGATLERHLDYWREQLAGLAPLDLPTDRPRPAVRSWVGDRVDFTLPKDLADRLRSLAQRHDTTLFTATLAGFQVLLSRYTGRRDIAVGSAMSGRDRAELSDLIGFFLHTVVLRARWRAEDSFAGLLAANHRTVLDAVEHQEAPVQRLVDELDGDRDLSRTPLFQAMFDFAEAPPERVSVPGLDLEPVELVGAIAKHDLRMELAELPDGALRGVLEFPTALFDRATVERMASHYRRLLEAVAADPVAPLSDVDILAPDERRALVGERNDTARDLSPEPVLAAVARRARTSPEAVAVVAGDDHLTAAELDARANQVAHLLRASGVGPETVVAVCLDRDLDLLPVLLGVWRAGGAYLPLDPSDPADRLEYVVRDAGAAMVVTRALYADRLHVGPSCPQVLVDVEAPLIDAQPETDPEVANDAEVTNGPESLAYLIYTSGSTGRPKGVMVTHRGLTNYLGWAVREYVSPQGNGAPLFSSVAFDLVVTALYVPLLAGQPVHLLPDGSVADLGERLATAARSGRFSFLKLTPGQLDALATQLDPARAAGLTDRLLVGGEGFASGLAARWWDLAGDGVTVVNEYGPTEITVANAAFATDGTDRSSHGTGELLPIGRPMPNTTVYVLDEDLRPAPVGVPGEVYVGGAQLARGYRHLPDLTAQRFVPDPFGPPGARLYRTGDLARWRADQQLEFLGRADQQVKVRGYRVETAEVAAVLREHPAVADAVVTLRTGAAGAGRLVAHLVPDGAAPADGELRSFLEQRLPAYMIPARFQSIAEIPLTSNGKTDYRALPDLEPEAAGEVDAEAAPRTPLEERIAAAWRAVLELDRVGVHDDFFDRGGDSLNAVAMVGELRDGGLDLTVQDVFEHPTIAELAELVGQRPEAAPATATVAPLQLISGADRDKLPPGVVDAYPLSMLQTGMVFEMLSGGEINYYHNATTYTIRDDAPFSLPALQAAAAEVVRRHEVLRTGFDLASYSEPLQLVYDTAAMPVGSQDLRHLTVLEQEQAVRRHMAAEREHLFDLASPTLLRAFAHVCADDRWQLTVTECHAVLEGWSYHLLLMELLRCYRQIRDTGTPEPGEPLAVRFADFIAAEQQALASDEDRGYWRRIIGESTSLELPGPWAAGPDQPREPYRLEVMFADLEEGLRALAKQAEVPYKAVLHAAHLKVMSMVSDAPDFYTGLVCDTRPEVTGGDRLYGLFLNTVPFRFRRTGRTWRELVREVFAQEKELWPHRRYPMLAMQRDLAGAGRLMDVMFNYLDFRTVDMDLVDFEASIDDSPNEFRMAVTAFRQGLLNLRLHPEAVSREHGERLAAMYRQVLTAMATDPDGDARRTYLPAGEHARQTGQWNDTAVVWPAATLPELFEQQVRATPDATALVAVDGTTVSYRELDQRANQLAHHLRGMGVGPEVFTGIFVEPGVDMMVGLLGILKAGGAFVPLDPEHPADRLAYMLSDTGAPVVLTQESLRERVPASAAQLVCLDADRAEIAAHPVTAPQAGTDPENLIYAMYTSGSTGRPKGVMISHRALLNYLLWAVDGYGLEGRSGAPMVGSIAFDLSVPNYFLPLIGGRDVTLLPPGRDLEALADLLRQPLDFSLLKATPAHMAMVRGHLDPDQLVTSVRTLVIGADLVPAQIMREWREQAPSARLINEYGPTETVVGCSIYIMPDEFDPNRPIPIGKPIANIRMYVLDANLDPVPIGAPGELYIAGEGVARGYLHRPDLTAEKFLPDPYSRVPGERCYRSGDRARFRPDGNLEFLGRVDHQLKIRGYRIEPGEIEVTLLTHPDVAEAVVVADTDSHGDKRLLGYVAGGDVAGGDARRPDPAALRSLLREKLPDYLVPAVLTVLDTLPRNPAGKIDRAALPAPEASGPEPDLTGRAPRSHRDEVLCQLFAEVLGVDRVSIDDDFFALGGHSLLSTRLLARIRATLRCDLSIRDVFDHPTPAGLSDLLSRRGPGRPALVPRPRPELVPLSHTQEGLWFIAQAEGPSSSYHMPVAFRLTGPLDVAAMDAAIGDLIERHEVLRTVLPDQDGMPYQRVLDTAEAYSGLEVRAVDDTDLATALDEAVRQPFDLATDPPLRTCLFVLGPQDHVLLVVLHHIAGDGWSMAPLGQDLVAAYEARCRREAPDLPPLPVQYADYVLWQRELLGVPDDPDSVLAQQLRFWRETLRGLPEELPIPTDRPRPTVPSTRGGAVDFAMSADLQRRLRETGRAAQASVTMVLQAAVATLLHRLGGGTDIPIGGVVAMRADEALADLVGLLVNTQVLRYDLSGDPTFAELLGRVRDADLAAYDHHDVPFERIVEAVNPTRSLSRHPLFQVMLTMQPEAASDFITMPGLDVTLESMNLDAAFVDLAFTFREHVGSEGEPAGVSASVQFNADLFDRSTVEAMTDRLLKLLDAVSARPEQRLHEIDVLVEGERDRLLVEWNDTAVSRRPGLFLDLFAERVAAGGDALAVVGADGELSFAALGARSDRLAGVLRAAGVGPERVVGVCLERGVDLVTAFLGVWKAGAAFVPLDPEHPVDRWRLMLGDSDVSVVVTAEPVASVLADADLGVSLVDVAEAAGGDAAVEGVAAVDPDGLAYVMYTSGSTGRPKGVQVSHQNLVHYLWWTVEGYAAFGSGGAPLFSPVAFDMVVPNIFTPLLVGQPVHVLPQQLDLARLGRLLWESGPFGFIKLTPGHAELLCQQLSVDQLSGLAGMLAIGADAFPGRVADQVWEMAGGTRLLNEYGPTEITVANSTFPIEGPSDRELVPIGRPIPNTTMFVLDEWSQPVPVGVVGEIVVGGVTVARGYRHLPELTAERFVPDPFGPPGSRLYRTGDLGRVLPDGNVEFVGRADDQVKLHGYRIEPGEIEAALARCEGVRHSVVTVREDRLGDRRLVAYVAPDDVDLRQVKQHLTEALPGYLVPDHLVPLAGIPLNENGKVDHRALPAPAVATAESIGVRTPHQEVVADIFADVLGVRQVGPDDDFFALGGHSMLAVRLVNRVRAALGTEVTVQDLWRARSVAGLVDLIAGGGGSDPYAVLLPLRAGDGTPLFCVHPVAGLAWPYAGLARHLPEGTPLFGVQARGLAAAEPLPERVEQMAEDYLAQVRAVQPSGPYQLLGWSFGGNVAHAMAVSLQRSGEQVSLLALIDSHLLRSWFRRGPDAAELREQHLNHGALRSLGGEHLDRVARVAANNNRLAARFRPGVFRGDVLYVAAMGGGAKHPGAGKWRRHVDGEIDVHRLEVGHFDVVRPEPLARIAEIVTPRLAL